MNKNININVAKILKDAPKGTKLWSPICGECELFIVDKLSQYPIKVGDEKYHSISFLSDGRYVDYPKGECLLFPSKDNRDWSTFKAPWKHKHFEPGQKVLVPYYDGTIHKWRLTFYSHYDKSIKRHITTCAMNFSDEDIIAYEGNEDKLGKLVE